MDGWSILAELKRDVFGSVELVADGERRAARRVARGSRVPGSRWLARVLLRREERALRALGPTPRVPTLVEDRELAVLPCLDGHRPREGTVLVRSWIAGEPLHRAAALPEDFFDRLDDLVVRLHDRGICHNDLHKEQNVLVCDDGFPALIDFQLASRHPRRGRTFRSRTHDDLRHVQKMRRRYTRDGRGPTGEEQRGLGHGKRRTLLPRLWRRLGKPAYLFVTRRLLGTRDGEERRPSSGPWPEWVAPVGKDREAY